MKNIKYLGYLCLVIVFGNVSGQVIENLSEGYPAFFGFSLSYKFSMDNTSTFIAYWGSLIGIFYFIRDFGSFKTLRQFIPHTNKLGYKSSSTIQDELSKIEDLYNKSIITKEERNEMRGRVLDIKGFSLSNTSNKSHDVPEEKINFIYESMGLDPDSPEFGDTPLGYFLLIATFAGAFIFIRYLLDIGVPWWAALILGVLSFGLVVGILDVTFQKKTYQEESKTEAISKSEVTSKPTKSFPWWGWVLYVVICIPCVLFLMIISTEFMGFQTDSVGDLVTADGAVYSFRWLLLLGGLLSALITVTIIILINVIFKKDW